MGRDNKGGKPPRYDRDEPEYLQRLRRTTMTATGAVYVTVFDVEAKDPVEVYALCRKIQQRMKDGRLLKVRIVVSALEEPSDVDAQSG